jgi:hypothetical protein
MTKTSAALREAGVEGPRFLSMLALRSSHRFVAPFAAMFPPQPSS